MSSGSKARATLRSVLGRFGLDVRRVPRPLTKHPNAKLSINLDDLVARCTRETHEIFFVQIGAFDGRTGDPIHEFVIRGGWRGILVEPHSRAFAELERTYAGMPELQLRNVAVSDRNGRRKLYAIRDVPGLPDWAPQVGTFDRARLVEAGFDEAVIEEQDVQCVTLSELLAGVERVDLLQVDVEGYDAEVIRLFDFDRYRPRIVHFENVALSRRDHEKAVARLIGYGYRIAVAGTDTLGWHEPAH